MEYLTKSWGALNIGGLALDIKTMIIVGVGTVLIIKYVIK